MALLSRDDGDPRRSQVAELAEALHHTFIVSELERRRRRALAAQRVERAVSATAGPRSVSGKDPRQELQPPFSEGAAAQVEALPSRQQADAQAALGVDV
jgi:hypothetical protein